MNLFKRNSILLSKYEKENLENQPFSYILTGIISILLAIFTGFALNLFFFQGIIILLVILIVSFIFIFYPINFIVIGMAHIIKGDLTYGINDYDKLNRSPYEYGRKRFLWEGLYIIVLFLINIILFLPIKLIICLIKRN